MEKRSDYRWRKREVIDGEREVIDGERGYRWREKGYRWRKRESRRCGKKEGERQNETQ